MYRILVVIDPNAVHSLVGAIKRLLAPAAAVGGVRYGSSQMTPVHSTATRKPELIQLIHASSRCRREPQRNHISAFLIKFL